MSKGNGKGYEARVVISGRDCVGTIEKDGICDLYGGRASRGGQGKGSF
jgi:hypothetical protein